MHRIRYFIEQSWLLITASLGFGLLLAATDYALGAAIARQELKKLNDRKLGKYQEAVVQAKEKLEKMVKKLETAKAEEKRLRIREKKVVQALQKAREVISSLKKSK